MSRDQSFLTMDLRDLFKHTVFIRHRLEEQFRDLDHQTETAKLGMWLFLATEIMMFGTLFISLGIYRYQYPVPFEKASTKLSWEIATANTLVLLVSSFTMVMAVHYSRMGDRKRIVRYLLLTAILGAAFLVLKGYEYYVDYEEYLIPGWRFRVDEWINKEHLGAGQVPHVRLFLLFYWIMTPIHALHMTVGIAAVLILAVLAARDHFSAEYYAPVDVVGLYWHFVDIVWIFILPMLYLQGTHSW